MKKPKFGVVFVAISVYSCMSASFSFAKVREEEWTGIRSIMVQGVLVDPSMNDVKLPTTPAEVKELDRKCLLGPGEFNAALVGDREEGQHGLSWSEMGLIGEDPIRYCHEFIAAVREAKGRR